MTAMEAGVAVLAADVVLTDDLLSRALPSSIIVDTVQDRLGSVAAALGLQVQFEVALTSAGLRAEDEPDEPEAAVIELTIGGERCRFPDELVPQVVAALTAGHGPERATAELAELPDADVPACVALVCAEALRLRPSVLLSPPVVTEFTDRLQLRLLPGTLPEPAWIRELLAAVVELGISVGDTAEIVRAVVDQEGQTAAEVAEAIIGELGASTIEMQVPDDVGSALGDADDENAVLGYVRTGMLEETGIVPPLVRCVDAEIAETAAFRVNGCVTAPLALVPADMCLVYATPSRLAELGFVGRSMWNAALGRENTLLPAAHETEVEALGYTTWTRSAHAALLLAGVIRRNLGCFVSRDRVLAQLDVLEESFPEVVRTARAQLLPSRLTALIRRLAGDQIPLTSWIPLLERVSDLPAAQLGWERYRVLDDPVYASESADRLSETESEYQFIRAGLRHQISLRFASSPGTLICYLLDAGLDDVIAQTDWSETLVDRILESIRRELALLPPTAQVPVLLTSASRRAPLQRLARTCEPLLVVLAHEDLPPDLAVQPVARIALLPEAVAA